MSKRANNEGSVFKRADGKWIAQITNNGKRPLRVRESQEEAIEALKELHKLQGKQHHHLYQRLFIQKHLWI